MRGQQRKRVGVDCVRFLCGVLDELFDIPHDGTVDLPQDVALHAPATARAAMRKIMALYPRGYSVLDLAVDAVEPGDVIVTGPVGGGPGHAMLVGADRDLWHATGKRVQRAGLTPEQPIYRAFRPHGKEQWANT